MSASRPRASPPDRLTLALFAAAILFGGSNFVAVRFSNAELAPYWGAAIRFLPASLIFFGVMLVQRIPFPRGASARGAVIYGALNFGLGYALLYYGLLDAPAGTAAVVMATVPLFTLAFVALHGLETFRVRGLVGALIALAGIALVFRDQLAANVPPVSLLAILGSAAVAAESGVIAKGLPRMHPVATNAVGMLVGAVVLFAVSLAASERWALPTTVATWLALAHLTIVGAVGLFWVFLAMLRRWTASASSYALVVMPVVAATLGALLRAELLSPVFLLGGALVAVGVYVGALSGSATLGSPSTDRPIPAPGR